MSASRANITGVSNTLEKEGLIARIPSSLDRRSSLLTLTPEGKRRFELAWLQIGELGRDVLKGFSEGEIETLLGLLGRLAKAASVEAGS
jgi:DNA-binding MarR family transcriptional regulator